MYWIFIFFNIILIVSLNLIFNFSWNTALNLLISFASILLPSCLGIIIQKFIPEKNINDDHFIFKEKKNEKNIFKLLKVKNWKDRIPNFIKIQNMSQINNDKIDKIYIEKFIKLTCAGELLHLFCIISSFISLFFIKKSLLLNMAIPIFVVYTIINLLSIIVQRYNRPRLKILLKSVKRKELILENSSSEEYLTNVGKL